jgi:NADH:ubiquinone oxidoreductase subunit E/NAD-dependent dihydropyrimidine dehydrogenase PreA subunit
MNEQGQGGMIAEHIETTVALGRPKAKEPSGAVLVCGGGIAGIQASLDLSASGFLVYLVEESPTIGGNMARLDKTFPTGDCATCIISPKVVACMRDLNIEVITMAEVVRLDGQAGNFKATVRTRPRSVNEDKCTGCGDCIEHCPVRNRPADVAPFLAKAAIDQDEKAQLGLILDKYSNDRSALIPVLQDITEARGYLPRPWLEELAVRLSVPLAEILRVASFYNGFSLKPVGRHIVEVCLGTACFVRGSGLLFERLEQEIGVDDGGTGKDGRFTLRSVRCIGCCALAPAMRIDGVTYGKVKLDKVTDLLKQYA